jgi:hypothetical protein
MNEQDSGNPAVFIKLSSIPEAFSIKLAGERMDRVCPQQTSLLVAAIPL